MSDDGVVRMAEEQPLIVERRADRIVVTLNRAPVRNAINHDMIDALHVLCDDLEREPRILILTGSGGVFASGADIRELRERRADDALRTINASAFIRIRRLPAPVIAAIDGYALGGGAELAYAADLRIGTPTLKMGHPETGLGIIAAAGAGWRLREIIGEPLAIELLLTGRLLNAQEALAAGLISAIHPADVLLDAAHTLADRIAANDPAAVRATKRVFLAPDDAHPRIDSEEQAVLFESTEKHRRMTEFLERRTR